MTGATFQAVDQAAPDPRTGRLPLREELRRRDELIAELEAEAADEAARDQHAPQRKDPPHA